MIPRDLSNPGADLVKKLTIGKILVLPFVSSLLSVDPVYHTTYFVIRNWVFE